MQAGHCCIRLASSGDFRKTLRDNELKRPQTISNPLIVLGLLASRGSAIRAPFPSSRFLEDAAPPPRGAHCVRALLPLHALSREGRREGRVQAAPMARLRKKCRRQVPQVLPNTPAFPARRSSRLYAVALVRRACWPPFATMLAHCAGHQHRGVRTLRLHVRKRSFVGASEDTLRSLGPSLPASRVVTIARNAPLR